MGLDDGNVREKYLYATSDLPFVAFLLLRGYELLGAVETDRVSNKTRRPIKKFGLTHTDPYVLADIGLDVQKKYTEYHDSYFNLVSDPEVSLNFYNYYLRIKDCHNVLDQALKRSQE